MGPGVSRSGQRPEEPHRAQSSACNLWRQEQPPVQHLKKRRPPVSPVLLSVEGLVHGHLIEIKCSEVLGRSISLCHDVIVKHGDELLVDEKFVASLPVLDDLFALVSHSILHY